MAVPWDLVVAVETERNGCEVGVKGSLSKSAKQPQM